jgi:hypothetical protein
MHRAHRDQSSWRPWSLSFSLRVRVVSKQTAREATTSSRRRSVASILLSVCAYVCVMLLVGGAFNESLS